MSGKSQYPPVLYTVVFFFSFFIRVMGETNPFPTADSNRVAFFSTEECCSLIEASKQSLSVSFIDAEHLANLALSAAKNLKNDSLLGEAYKNAGNMAYYVGDNPKALIYYDSSLVFFHRLNDPVNVSKVYNNIGLIYSRTGLFDKALEYHQLSLSTKRSTGDSSDIAGSLSNIGSVYFTMGKPEEAFTYFRKGLALAQQNNLPYFERVLLNNIGMVYNSRGEFRDALRYFTLALHRVEEEQSPDVLSDIHLNIGKTYTDLKHYDSALYHFSLSFEINKRLGINKSVLLNNIGQVYIEKKEYGKALQHLNEAMALAEQSGDIADLMIITKNMSVLYERTGRFEKAYHYLMRFKEYDDSLNLRKYSRQLFEAEVAFQTEKAEKEIELLKKEKQVRELEILRMKYGLSRQRFLIYTFVAGIILTGLFAYFMYRMYRDKTKANQILKNQYEAIARAQMIFDSSPYSISLATFDGTIIDCNPAGVKLFGYNNREDVTGRNIAQFLSTGNTKNGVKNFQNAFNESSGTRNEYILHRKDGSEFFAEVSSAVVRDNAQNPVALVTNVVDISERVHFIHALEVAKAKAEEADRLKSAFLANMSHEIRTPMNSIVGFINLMTDQGFEDKKMREYAGYILTSSEALLNIIDDIIDISKIEVGQLRISKSRFVLEELLSEVYNALNKAGAEYRFEFSLSIPDTEVKTTIFSDRFRLRQILNNLVGNACKFTEKGSVVIGFEKIRLEEKTAVKLFVSDTGMGIPDGKEHLVFERFSQLEDVHTRRYRGAGLGLYISRHLAGLLGGELHYEPNPSGGSVFWMVLPLE